MSQHTISRTLSKAILKDEVRIKLKIWNTYLTGKLTKFDIMIRGASIIFIGQDREKLIFAQDDEEKLLHREETEEA